MTSTPDRRRSQNTAQPHPTPNCRVLGQAGLAIIRRFEVFSPVVYLHRKGFHAIGYAHRLRGDEIDLLDFPISHETAEMLLRQDCRLLELYLNATTHTTLAQHEFDALCSLLFDVGLKAFERSPLRAWLNAGQRAKVVKEFHRFDDRAFGQSPNGATRRRRHAEKSLFAGPPSQ